MRSRCRCSLSPAIRISSRGWPRSSSTDEPSDPPSRVFNGFVFAFGFYFSFEFWGVREVFEEEADERKKIEILLVRGTAAADATTSAGREDVDGDAGGRIVVNAEAAVVVWCRRRRRRQRQSRAARPRTGRSPAETLQEQSCTG